MRYLDHHNQQAFRDELNNLFYDELSTYDETEKQIRKWYICYEMTIVKWK